MRTARYPLVLTGLLWGMGAAHAQQIAGDRYPVTIDTPRNYPGFSAAGPAEDAAASARRTWRHVLHHPGATYLAVHFVDFDLGPGDWLLVSDAAGQQACTLTGRGKMGAGTFWARHVRGEAVVLELYVGGAAGGRGFVIDEYAAGRPAAWFAEQGFDTRETCGADDKRNAVCFAASHPQAYERGRAVCRLLTNGTAFCTGWLASPDNHVITNAHCISTPEEALNTDFEFMAEAPDCEDENCADCWPGIVFSGAVLLAGSVNLDYTLLQIAEGDPAAQFGYLELESRGPRIGEEIYLPGHPGGRAKEFALLSTVPEDPGGVAHVQTLDQPPCIGGEHGEVGYFADTIPGSSGSPVLSPINHRVVALHHCGVCPNRGVPIQLIQPEIAAHLQPGPRGSVGLDWDVYDCAALVHIDLRDGQLAGNATQGIAVGTSGGDTETVVLHETGAATAIFAGTIQTASGPLVGGDGILQVADGETLTASYADADDGSGAPALATDTALADCQPPQIASVQATSIGAHYAVVTVTVDEPVRATIFHGRSCAELADSAAGGVPVTPTSVMLTGLYDATTYYYAVAVADRAGNVSTADNGGQCYSFTTLTNIASFTELFAAADNDLDWHTLRFTPDGSADFYNGCAEPISGLPTDPAGGITLNLTNDSFLRVPLFGFDTIKLYGASYSAMYVGSNGYVTFTAGDSDPTESLADHFDTPRISGLFDNLNPAAGGRVAWQQFDDRAVVTYENVPDQAGGVNTVQIEMFFDGRIALSYRSVAATGGLAGLSPGMGLSPDFIASDLTGQPDCTPPLPGDFDDDGDVDAADFAAFAGCLGGPGITPAPPPPAGGQNCLDAFDAETDGDVDLPDFAALQRVFTG